MDGVGKLSLKIKIGSTVAPGDKIGSTRQLQPGAGTYIRGSHIFSSAVGTLRLSKMISAVQTKSVSNRDDAFYVASVILKEGTKFASSQVLSVDQIVMGRINRIMTQQASMEIVAAEGVGSLDEHYEGVIRKEDVRTGTLGTVEVHESFRPGDIVRARIISLGDSRRYILSTAENDLGVIRAVSSSSGRVMIPISWKEMQCPETKAKELRKCAKPRENKDTPSNIINQS
mmetsp:Transcript_21390/g.29973  ORF Transcript_21390/g.29973 Transcript_21390/m.29973 type:complete len:229 (+) Transcript_21390:186-872(+)